jgi:hypothetical protein
MIQLIQSKFIRRRYAPSLDWRSAIVNRRWLLIALALTVGFASGCGREGSAEQGAESDGKGFLASLFGPKTVHVVIPAGTTFSVALDHGLSSENNSPGDEVRGHLVSDLVADGKVVARAGAPVEGQVTTAERSGRVKGRARLALAIRSIETLDGWKDVQTAMTAGSLVAGGNKKRDAATIAGGTAAGAVLGEIIGDKPGLGAVIGGAAGTGVVLSTRGKEVHVAPGARLKFRLENSLELDVPADEAKPVAAIQ